MNKTAGEGDGRLNLPIDARQVLKTNLLDNLYLLFNRFSKTEENIKLDTHKVVPIFDIDLNSVYCQKRNSRYLEILNRRARKMADTLPRQWKFTFHLRDKLAIGIGANSPYGNFDPMTLHPVYGIPYLPGSALKGAIRHCWIQEKFSGHEEDALKSPEFTALFGCGKGENSVNNAKAQTGVLVFFDSFPNKYGADSIAFDVMTPHFKDYYDSEGAKEPTDDQNPLPIQFTVAKNIDFLILIGATNPEQWDFLQQELKEIVGKTLMEYGIGAKTALGYGSGNIE